MDIDDHSNGGSPDGVNSRSQEVWGLRYIDDAMVRLLDKNLDGDCRDSGELFWQLSDAQFSTVAVIDKNAVLQERVSYTSYGVGTHRWPHEVNNSGGVVTSGSTSDYGVIDGLAQANSGAGTPINDPYGNYNVAADLNRDGVIDSTDTSLFDITFGGAKSALASGIISDPTGPENVFGYDGYVYNPDQGLYTVRFRWYSPTFGRWLERDPAGYVDGANLSQFVLDNPATLIDPLGLDSNEGPWWHHLLPKPVQEELEKNPVKDVDCDAAEYGRIFPKGTTEHRGFRKWHREWNDEWAKFVKANRGSITKELIDAKLKALAKDPRFADIMSKCAPANVCHKTWRGLDNPGMEKLAKEAAEAAKEMNASIAKSVANRLKGKLKFVKGIPAITIVLIIVDTAKGKDVSYAILDNALNPLPLSIEEQKQIAKDINDAMNDYKNNLKENIAARRMRNTSAQPMDNCSCPFPTETGSK
jgi:RHS repeat-associated protein